MSIMSLLNICVVCDWLKMATLKDLQDNLSFFWVMRRRQQPQKKKQELQKKFTRRTNPYKIT